MSGFRVVDMTPYYGSFEDISQSLLGNLKSFVGPSVGVKYYDGSTYLYGKVYAPSDGWYDWNDVTSTTYIGKGLLETKKREDILSFYHKQKCSGLTI